MLDPLDHVSRWVLWETDSTTYLVHWFHCSFEMSSWPKRPPRPDSTTRLEHITVSPRPSHAAYSLGQGGGGRVVTPWERWPSPLEACWYAPTGDPLIGGPHWGGLQEAESTATSLTPSAPGFEECYCWGVKHSGGGSPHTPCEGQGGQGPLSHLHCRAFPSSQRQSRHSITVEMHPVAAIPRLGDSPLFSPLPPGPTPAHAGACHLQGGGGVTGEGGQLEGSGGTEGRKDPPDH